MRCAADGLHNSAWLPQIITPTAWQHVELLEHDGHKAFGKPMPPAGVVLPAGDVTRRMQGGRYRLKAATSIPARCCTILTGMGKTTLLLRIGAQVSCAGWRCRLSHACAPQLWAGALC